MFLFLIVGCGLCFQTQKLEEVSVSFEVTHMGALTVEGSFTKIEEWMTKISTSEWRIAGEVKAPSIDTGNSSRDETLLTEQYLNVEAYPTIPFEATLQNDGTNLLVVIELEIRGIQTQLTGELHEEDGNLVSSKMVLDREKIGLDFGLMDSLIGDEVSIVIHSGIKLSIMD